MRVFLSFSHEDKKAADLITAGLTAHGVEVWPTRPVKSGESWQEALVQARNQVDAAIVLLSPNFLKSRFAIVETSNIKSAGKPVLPVILAGQASDYLPLLSETLAVRFSVAAPESTVAQLLVALQQSAHPSEGQFDAIDQGDTGTASELAQAKAEISRLQTALASAEAQASIRSMDLSRASVSATVPIGVVTGLLAAAASLAIVLHDARFLILAALAPILVVSVFIYGRGRR